MVRQTVSKWEKGLSVSDSDLLIAISEVLDTPVSTLLGESVTESESSELQAISQKLETINTQLAQRKELRRKTLHWILIALASLIVLIAVILFLQDSPYLDWNYSDPESAVLGVIVHAFEWLFIRLTPIALIGCIVGIVMTRRKDR